MYGSQGSLVSHVDSIVGGGVEAAVLVKHRLRLRRRGWGHAFAPEDDGLWAAGDPPPRDGCSLEVLIDGAEIHDHAWLQPADALARRDAGEIDLAPPTWVTLWRLSAAPTVAAAVDDARRREPEKFETHIVQADGVPVAVWHGDPAYETGDINAPGPRHRLLMLPDGWRFEDTRS